VVPAESLFESEKNLFGALALKIFLDHHLAFVNLFLMLSSRSSSNRHSGKAWPGADPEAKLREIQERVAPIFSRVDRGGHYQTRYKTVFVNVTQKFAVPHTSG
jgi:hypothetical protein